MAAEPKDVSEELVEEVTGEVIHGAEQALDAVDHAHGGGGLENIDAVRSYIEHHIADSQNWHLPFGIDIHLPPPISLHVVMMFIAAGFLIFLFVGLYKKDERVPSGVTNLLEVLILFIRDQIAIPAMGERDGKAMTPLFCSFFFFILCLNLMGLIPLFSTATANLGVTAGLATTTFAAMIFGPMLKFGPAHVFKAFVPHGVPLPVLFIVTPLEMIVTLVKTFALTVRLFANLLAGHVVVLTLIGLIAAFGTVAIPAIALALLILLIEVLVAFIQAYVFTLLSALFIGQIYHPAH